MKRVLLLVVVVLFARFSIAQSQEGTIDYMKTQQPAAIMELPYPENVVQGALKDFFGKQGSKGANSKGLLVYKNVRAEGGADSPLMDMYFKIDRKSRKEKDVTVVYLTAAHPGENIAVRLPSDRYGVERGRDFLNSITPALEAYNLELQITDQENEVKKADRKYNSLISEGEDLVKKKKSIEDKIAANIKDREEQRVNLEKQKAILEALNKRKAL